MTMFDFNTAKIVSHSEGCNETLSEMFQDDFYPYTPEEQIEYIARVSNPSSQSGEHSEAGKLTKYLINNAHWSPLEMVSVVMEVNTTRDIGRQLLRHRSFSFQEFSQRYADVNDLQGSFVIKPARSQDLKNRQNSNDDMSDEDKQWWTNVQSHLINDVMQQYNQAIERGIAKEVARSILPEGLTPTRMYVQGTVRSWYHYCDLRCANGTQAEHMDLAQKCKTELAKVMPNLFGE